MSNFNLLISAVQPSTCLWRPEGFLKLPLEKSCLSMLNFKIDEEVFNYRRLCPESPVSFSQGLQSHWRSCLPDHQLPLLAFVSEQPNKEQKFYPISSKSHIPDCDPLSPPTCSFALFAFSRLSFALLLFSAASLSFRSFVC